MTSAQKLGFYATPPHKCSYLSEQQAVTLFADPQFPKNMRLYSALMGYGFRRSGTHLYIPRCDNCNACISVRIPVDEFTPSKSQNRISRKNRDLRINAVPAGFRQSHFELYEKYLARRHPGGGMDNPTPATYSEFLITDWADTLFYEFILEDRLVAVAVTDLLDDALSAVYTFYDPDIISRSPGKFAILFQINEARKLGLKWLYLGYWIKESKKMNYKSEFRPQQHYYASQWHDADE